MMSKVKSAGSLGEAIAEHSAVAASSAANPLPDVTLSGAKSPPRGDRPLSARRKGAANDEPQQPDSAPVRARTRIKPDIPARFLRPPELAKMVGISTRKIYDMLARGEIPCTRIGPFIRVPATVVEDYIRDALGESAESKRA
jgi:excisionase family DNA binding protein